MDSSMSLHYSGYSGSRGAVRLAETKERYGRGQQVEVVGWRRSWLAAFEHYAVSGSHDQACHFTAEVDDLLPND